MNRWKRNWRPRKPQVKTSLFTVRCSFLEVETKMQNIPGLGLSPQLVQAAIEKTVADLEFQGKENLRQREEERKFLFNKERWYQLVYRFYKIKFKLYLHPPYDYWFQHLHGYFRSQWLAGVLPHQAAQFSFEEYLENRGLIPNPFNFENLS